MSSDHLKTLLSYIEFCFPQAFAEIEKNDLINENLFSPFSLRLPKEVLQRAEKFVGAVYQTRDSKEYRSELNLPENFIDWPSTKSLLTCFDFHYTEEKGLKLIEINTNASLYLPIVLQRCAQVDLCTPPQIDDLLASFVETFDLKTGDGISVFDEKPEQEGLYFEFLIFKEWLAQKGFKTNIVSLQSFSQMAFDNVYNRYTDFYLEEAKSASVKNSYFSGEKRFSPNPREYALMADKRCLNVIRHQLLKTHSELAPIVPETRTFSEFDDKEQIWQERKNFFFKPSSGFGSKGAFAGKSISRKAFENIYAPDFIAQEYCPAGKQTFEKEGKELTMKFDIRVFTFEGRIQNYGARLYQGQTTNMRTQWGGVAPIALI